MYCPFCSHEGTRVLESRLIENQVRRRRECGECSNRFTTYEKAVFHLIVLKKDGQEEPFNSDKIRSSIAKALAKEEDESIIHLAKRIEQQVLAKKERPLKTTTIGKIVLKELKKVDKIAYLRFASIHKKIDDPKQLEQELELISQS